MWGKKDKVWQHYRHDILAFQKQDAVLLEGFIRHVAMNRVHINHLEVMDLQRYKLIKQPNKVRAALNDRAHIPFIFVTGKN